MKEADCGVPKCNKTTWDFKTTRDSKSEMDAIIVAVYASPGVSVIREKLIYGKTNLLSDIGGYLGLFLGYSLLSVYLDVMKLMHMN